MSHSQSNLALPSIQLDRRILGDLKRIVDEPMNVHKKMDKKAVKKRVKSGKRQNRSPRKREVTHQREAIRRNELEEEEDDEEEEEYFLSKMSGIDSYYDIQGNEDEDEDKKFYSLLSSDQLTSTLLLPSYSTQQTTTSTNRGKIPSSLKGGVKSPTRIPSIQVKGKKKKKMRSRKIIF